MSETTWITDASAPCLAHYRLLTQPKRPDAPIVVEGILAIERLLAAGHAVDSVLTTPDALVRLNSILPAHVQRWVAPAAILRDIVGFGFHHGALALAPRPAYRPPRAVLRTVVVGERLTDPANVGALIRNAKALGADAVWLDPGSADPFSRRAIRAAMGWCFALPVRQIAIDTALCELTNFVRVAASCASTAWPLPAVHWPPHCALLVGNEGSGLSASLLACADMHVRIPMIGTTDSLNVAAATAVLLYSRMSQSATCRDTRVESR